MRNRSASYYLIVFSVIIVGSSLLMLPGLLYLENLKTSAIERLERAIQRKVSFEQIEVSFDEGIGFRIDGLSIKEADGARPIIEADHIFVGLDVPALFRKKVRIDTVYLYRPRVFLERDASGTFNIADLFSSQYVRETYAQGYTDRPAAGSFSLLLWKDRVVISEGEVFYWDGSVADQGLHVHLGQVNLSLSNRLLGSTLQVEGTAILGDAGGASSTIRLQGDLGGLKQARSIAEIDFDITAQAASVPLDRYVPYVWKGRSGEHIQGIADVTLVFKGRYPFPAALRVKASATNALWTCPSVYKEPFRASKVSLDALASLTQDDLGVSGIEINVDGIRIQGDCTLKGVFGKGLYIQAHLSTNELPATQGLRHLPTGLLNDPTWDFIISMTKGGTTSVEAHLEGRPEDFSRLDTPEGQKTLQLVINVKDAVVVLPVEESYLPFQQISGSIELKEGHLFFRDFSAFYGRSLLSHAEGEIKDVHKARSHLDVKGSVQLGFAQAIQELDHGIIPDAVRKIARSLHGVSGQADLALQILYDYGVGEEELRVIGSTRIQHVKASYSHLAFPFQEIRGEIDFTDTSLALRNLRGNWESTSILAEGTLRFDTGNDPEGTLAFTLNALPVMDVFQLLGGGTQVSGEGALSVQGRCVFGGTGRLGPHWRADIQSPAIHVCFSERCVPLKSLSLCLDQSGTTIRISNLQWQTKGDSNIRGEGTLEQGDPVRLDVRLSSPLVDFNEIYDESPPARLRKLLPRNLLHRPSPSQKALAVTCQLDLGRSTFRTFQFSSVSATASWEKGRFRVKDLHASMDGGSISLISDAWKEKDRVPFDVTLTLDEIDISRLLSSLSVADSLFQGNLFLSGEFHGLWKGIGGWKKYLGGDLYLDSRGGVIRRYELLTKILTLVNFTQWSSVRLSDLKARGLPYQRISGHLALDSGVLSTEDLCVDTSIAFVTVVGSYDYLRDNLDVQLAAKPLEKLDRVIDQVPVVGGILEGEDDTTVIFYYNLSGTMKDPQVALVPFKGMSERLRGLLDKIRTGIESRQF